MSLKVRVSLLKFLDATVGYALCKAVGLLRHVAGRPELAPDPAEIRRLLLIRPGGIGDMLMLLPLLDAIEAAHPHVVIDIICEKRNRPVLELAGRADGALLYDSAPLRLLRRLRARRYDAVVDTEQFHNFSAIMAWLSGAPVRVGFRINPARIHLYTHLVNYTLNGYELHEFARLLHPLGVRLKQTSLHGTLRHASGTLRPLRPAALRGDNAGGGGLIAVSAGSSNAYKHWDAGKFVQLLDRLTERGHPIAIVGNAAESGQARRLVQSVRSTHVQDFTGRLSLMETAAVLDAATLYIGCDSGLGHLAAALGCRTVILFGPSDPRKWSRPADGQAIVRRPLPCSPCALFGYYKLCRDIPCMGGLTVDDVATAVDRVLQADGGSAAA